MEFWTVKAVGEVRLLKYEGCFKGSMLSVWVILLYFSVVEVAIGKVSTKTWGRNKLLLPPIIIVMNDIRVVPLNLEITRFIVRALTTLPLLFPPLRRSQPLFRPIRQRNQIPLLMMTLYILQLSFTLTPRALFTYGKFNSRILYCKTFLRS